MYRRDLWQMALAIRAIILAGFGAGRSVLALLFLAVSQTLPGAATATDFKALFGDTLPPGTTHVEAAWLRAIIYLPAGALKDGSGKHFRVSAKKADWAAQAKARLKDGVRLPAVIYLHGCSGFVAGGRFARFFLDEGFAFFAPDSFADGRQELCGEGMMDARIKMRREELTHALAKVRDVDWIESSRLVLAGFSEGSQAVSSWKGSEFIAHVLLGTDCRHVGGSPNAAEYIPVLNMVGSNDEWGYSAGCLISDKRPKGSKRVVVQGADHGLSGSEIPKVVVSEFLKTCCTGK